MTGDHTLTFAATGYPLVESGLQWWPSPRLGAWRCTPAAPFVVDGIYYEVLLSTGAYLSMIDLVDDDECESEAARMRANQPMTDDEIRDYLRTGLIDDTDPMF